MRDFRSDLHALKHAEKMVENSRKAGALFPMDLQRDIVMGHEFCAEVVDYGPGVYKRRGEHAYHDPRGESYVLDTLGEDAEFVRGLHSVGMPLRPDQPDNPWRCNSEKNKLPFSGDAGDLVLRLGLRRQRAAGEKMPCAADCLGAGARRRLDG